MRECWNRQELVHKVVTLSAEGLTRRAIARALSVSRNTVRKILAEHRAAPVDLKLLAELDRIVAAADEAAAKGELSHAFGGGSIGSLVATYKKEGKA